jgi:carnosine N-methyltransferase
LGYKKKLDEVDKAILVNADFLAQIVSNPEIFGRDLKEEEGEEGESNADPSNLAHSHESGASVVLFRTDIF